MILVDFIHMDDNPADSCAISSTVFLFSIIYLNPANLRCAMLSWRVNYALIADKNTFKMAAPMLAQSVTRFARCSVLNPRYYHFNATRAFATDKGITSESNGKCARSFYLNARQEIPNPSFANSSCTHRRW